MKLPRTALFLLVAALPLTACGGGTKAIKDRPYIARDVESLYNVAKTSLDQHQYKLAAAQFDEVERQHPYSVWARRAQLMSAYSYYAGEQYSQAVLAAQRFLSLHPGNRDAPYAYYIVAVSYYEQIASVERDQKVTQQALDALGELVRRYPDTAYARDARLKIDLARDHLAGKEMEIGRFYEKNRRWLSAAGRFRNVLTNYQTTSHVPEALYRLTESYLALGIPEEAHKSAAVLGANFPDSKWYNRAYGLVTKNKA